MRARYAISNIAAIGRPGRCGPVSYLHGLPIVGGSAGDDLKFERTHILHDGRFVTNAASLVLFETSLPFAPFKFQHFERTNIRFVVTGAEPSQRLITEIDGYPAASRYAELLNVAVDTLGYTIFSRNPLTISVAGEEYIRSIQRINEDGSLGLYSAIDEGIVLRIGHGVDPLNAAERAFASVRQVVGNPQLIVGFDCVLRRLELAETGHLKSIEKTFMDNNVVGFCTYGEQFNGLHINQTFTGVALGY
ncbi:MAG: FIST C-terminal domain-containing protein [Deltaproteobacteria bacterium]|nr:FIST C-terminal domain-containing protein [Deltaproteobacteria bacterium]